MFFRKFSSFPIKIRGKLNNLFGIFFEFFLLEHKNDAVKINRYSEINTFKLMMKREKKNSGTNEMILGNCRFSFSQTLWKFCVIFVIINLFNKLWRKLISLVNKVIAICFVFCFSFQNCSRRIFKILDRQYDSLPIECRSLFSFLFA